MMLRPDRSIYEKGDFACPGPDAGCARLSLSISHWTPLGGITEILPDNFSLRMRARPTFLADFISFDLLDVKTATFFENFWLAFSESGNVPLVTGRTTL
jgi:hypothetical protein